MLYLAFVVEILLMIGLPLGLWSWLRRWPGVTWRLLLVGAATFVLSQVVHIPLLMGLTEVANRPGVWPFAPGSLATTLANATILGLAAGVCEEGARYLVLRLWQRQARSWAQGVAFGAGHGGAEAIIVGLGVLATFAVMLYGRLAGLEGLGLSGDNLQQIQAQMAEYWSIPWYLPLLGGVERIFAIILHISWALLVLLAVVRRNPGWLGLAILGHAVVDGVAVGMQQMGGSVLAIEGLVLLFAAGGLAIILALRSRLPGPADVSRETSPVAVDG
jgi:uncharacterized membrane protein YhfC